MKVIVIDRIHSGGGGERQKYHHRSTVFGALSDRTIGG